MPTVLVPYFPKLCTLAKKILSNGLPTDYNYHGTPAPWLQINILALFRMFRNISSTEQVGEISKLGDSCPDWKFMIPIIFDMLQSASDGQFIDNAIITEVISTITALPEIPAELLEAAGMSKLAFEMFLVFFFFFFCRVVLR